MSHNLSDYFRKNEDSMDQLKTTPNAGTYRFWVVSFQLTVLSDGYGNFPATQPTWAPEATAEDLKQALESAFLPTDQLTLSFNPMLIVFNKASLPDIYALALLVALRS